MKKELQTNKVKVKPSNLHGYGVFAADDIKLGEVIEECRLILSDEIIEPLKNYIFEIGDKVGVILGCGMIYNHSSNPNACYYFDEKAEIAVFEATRPIAKNEEILIDYGKEWFSLRKMPIKKIPLWQKWLNPKRSFFMRILLVNLALLALVEFVKLA